MKETLRIAFVDFWPEWSQEDFITPILEKYYNVVNDLINPDVVFHSIFNGQRDIKKYKCKRVLFLGENWRPKQFSPDYSISFDPTDDTNFRLPLWQAYILLNPAYLDSLLNRVNHTEFDRFASFTVSNGANFIRNGMFNQLSQYKTVYSYGRYSTNNYELQNLSQGKYWRDAKNEFFNKFKHKFAITYENTKYPYYCTEKLMDGFLAGSLPIYWGDPNVNEDWNENAFINMNNYNSNWNFGLEFIKEIDKNENKFLEIYNQPIFTNEQKDKLSNNLGEFETWIIKNIK